MSSNIEVEKICQFCGNKFIAKTTVTKYCGDICAKRAYKQRKRIEKLSDAEIEELLNEHVGPDRFFMRNSKKPLENIIKKHSFFTVRQTAVMLGVSERTLFRMIERGQIKAKKLGGRTLIKSQDIEELVKY